MIPSLDNLALFAAASALLALTPGPNLLYLVSRTICQGRQAGIVSLAGTSLG
ncbi:MAG TPA: LysE family translocator, partial [Casimicrobiaceae bacterium]|nr:LysE family translocator [Casimicrobiaceae bacterium]